METEGPQFMPRGPWAFASNFEASSNIQTPLHAATTAGPTARGCLGRVGVAHDGGAVRVRLRTPGA
jgi:hypothetical protein